MQRRNFIKQSLAAGGSAAIFSSMTCLGANKNQKQTDSNEILKTIKNLRTIHGNFTDKMVPDEQIEQILQASLQAANASNMQTYSIIVVKDRAKMKNICGYQGGALLLYCVDVNRIQDGAKHLGYVCINDNIVNFVTAGMNAMLAAQTAVIAAKSLEIDSLLTNGIHRGDMERLWKILDLPKKGCFPMIALVLGYPAQLPAHDKGRYKGPGIIHHEKYHRMSKEEINKMMEVYDDPETHVALNENWSQGDHKHYFDWLFKNWLRGSDKPTTEETQMFKLLKRSGFVDLQG